jgi:hypothetical protein
VGVTAGTVSLLSGVSPLAAPHHPAPARARKAATVRAAFLYPPSETLRREGYWSWPGSGFDAEGRHKTYLDRIRAIEEKLKMRVSLGPKPLDQPSDVSQFIAEVSRSKPDGLLLVPLKKSHYEHAARIIEQTGLPAVVLATLGVLLSDHIVKLHRHQGAYLISALDDFGAVEYGMKMIRTGRWMKDARIVAIVESKIRETSVPGLGTQVLNVPHARFVELFQQTQPAGDVLELARSYRESARAIVEPAPADIVDAARAYFVLRQIVEEEQADAVMMDCLPGLRIPHKHCPPCLGFMSLRDQGIPAGCQADLNATLTMMLVQQLFDRPGFQQNAAMDTEKNLYFGSHCTSPSKMMGADGPAEPYILRSHAEAGWGCVPRVLFPAGQELTMALYQQGEPPRMLIYTGKAIECPEIPPAGGCRTNVTMTINEVPDVCDVQGMHQIVFYGSWGKQLRSFCQLHGIEAVS